VEEDQTANQECPALMPIAGHKVHPAQMANPDPQELMDKLVSLLEKANLGLPVTLDNRDHPVHRARREIMAILAPVDHQVLLDHKLIMVPVVPQEIPALPVRQDHPERMLSIVHAHRALLEDKRHQKLFPNYWRYRHFLKILHSIFFLLEFSFQS